MATPYPAHPSNNHAVTITPREPEIPTSVDVTEGPEGYTFTFRLTRDEFDALRLFGLHPSIEVDSHVIRRADGIMRQFAQVYSNQCFNEQKPLDCFCPKELFRRYRDKTARSADSQTK